MAAELLTRLPVVDAVLDAHAGALGRDLTAYRHHVYRVVNLAAQFGSRDREWLEQAEVAGAFHDLGIWTAGTFDYLEPSVALARPTSPGPVARRGPPRSCKRFAITTRSPALRGPAGALAEPFRRADWTDVTLGWRRFGLPASVYAAIRARWPDAWLPLATGGADRRALAPASVESAADGALVAAPASGGREPQPGWPTPWRMTDSFGERPSSLDGPRPAVG